MKRLWRASGAVLGLLAGCATYEVVPLYGVVIPDTGWSETYDLAGTTVDAHTGAAIPGIQVSLGGAVARSDSWGEWELAPDYPCESDCTLVAEDIDGPAHGAYQDAEQDYSMGDPYDKNLEIALELQD